MVSGSYDKTVKLWDFQQKRCLAEFIGHSSFVYAVDITNVEFCIFDVLR